MPGPAAILKQIHHLRRHVADLELRIEQAPKQLASQQKKLATQEEAGKAAHEQIKRIQLDIRDKEGSVKATQAQIKKYQKQLEEAANKKEYDTLKAEIAAEHAHISKVEDEILALMGQQDEKTGQLPEVDKALAKARADYAQFEKDHAERVARQAAEKDRALQELQTVEATLPADVRPQYERLVHAKKTDALASVKNRICSACYTEITAQMQSELQREVFILCKNCGRMLYLEG